MIQRIKDQTANSPKITHVWINIIFRSKNNLKAKITKIRKNINNKAKINNQLRPSKVQINDKLRIYPF